MKKKKLEQSPNDVILTSDIIPSTITATSTSNIKFTTSLPVTLSNPSSIIQNISTVPHILATSNIPTVSSIPSTSKFVTNIKKNISIRTAEKAASTRDLNSELLNQILQLRNQTKFIKTLQKRITEVERQRDHWKLRYKNKFGKTKINNQNFKPLSPLDDLLFCVRFDLSTKKRRKMKAFLRERHIELFAKNEDVRKLEIVKDIESKFEYKEVIVTDKHGKDKIVHSIVSTDPKYLITSYLACLDDNKKLTAVNNRIRGAVSGDDGRGWTKICFIPLDVPLSSSRDNALVLAIFDAKDNYESILKFCKALFDLINGIITIEINGTIFELELFAIGDMCFLCALFGHGGHTCTYPCLFCYIRLRHLHEVGEQRIYEEMITNSEENKFSQKYKPLLNCKVSNIVPSVLHIPLGIGSDALKIFEKLENQIQKTGSMKNILAKYNLSRDPRTKQLNGNNMRKFLTTPTIFTDIRNIFTNTPNQDIADKVIDVCSTLGLIQGMMTIKIFDERQISNIKNLIQRFKELYISSPLNFTPKGHWLVFHVVKFIENHKIWGTASEHGQEAIHGSTDDDMYRYRSLPSKKKLQLVARNCFLRNLILAKSRL
uniref:Uncharacterized protein n=1 Tax=Panagrolaimus davidi TaxID=227884 RepID=A0A914QCM2_9BILA